MSLVTSAKIKKAGRVLKIITKNLLLFPFGQQSARQFLRYIYAFDPIDTSASSPVQTINIFELFPKSPQVCVMLKDLRLQYGNMSYEEIYTVSLIVKCIQPQTIFEFGTFDGTTTLQMALNTSATSKIFTLNLTSEDVKTKYPIGTSDQDLNLPSVQSGAKFQDSLEAAKITQLYGDSAVFDYTPYYGRMDLILIDGSHEYHYVKNDTIEAMKMLRKQGIILWHDYPNAQGVARYINEIGHDLPIYHLTGTSLAIYWD